MKGYRTLLANGLASIIPFLELAELRDVMPDEWLPWYAFAVAGANIVLRMVTTTPVGSAK